MAKKRRYPTDTEVGIRRINEIEKLPVGELTDEEICKLFFNRFDANALVMVYVDRQDQEYCFGRLRTQSKIVERYRKLLGYLGYREVKTDVEELDDDSNSRRFPP